jgi:hypothetical protein
VLLREPCIRRKAIDFFNLLFNHFFEVIIFLFLFGGSIGAALRWFIQRSFQHRERMQEKRNEELRLRIQLEQVSRERSNVREPSYSSDPLPKDTPWNDQVQTTYEQGYQQQIYEQS